MNEWTNERIHEFTNQSTNEFTNERTNKQTNEPRSSAKIAPEKKTGPLVLAEKWNALYAKGVEGFFFFGLQSRAFGWVRACVSARGS